MKIGILGAGAWGTALAFVCARGGHAVTLWSYDGEMHEFATPAPSGIELTRDLPDMAGTDLWIVVTPAAFVRETMRRAAPFFKGQPILICSKGIEQGTGAFMAEVIQAEIPTATDIGAVSGPQFAAEVAAGVPTGTTLAGTARCRDMGRVALAELYIQETDDIIGAEVCGAGKNAVALICGYVSVTAAGENERACVLARAWDDVVNFGVALGGGCRTFLGLCGVGDLFLSATSVTSRNFSGGADIARGIPPTGTVEGIIALGAIVTRATELGIDVPVLNDMARRMGIIRE